MPPDFVGSTLDFELAGACMLARGMMVPGSATFPLLVFVPPPGLSTTQSKRSFILPLAVDAQRSGSTTASEAFRTDIDTPRTYVIPRTRRNALQRDAACALRYDAENTTSPLSDPAKDRRPIDRSPRSLVPRSPRTDVGTDEKVVVQDTLVSRLQLGSTFLYVRTPSEE